MQIEGFHKKPLLGKDMSDDMFNMDELVICDNEELIGDDSVDIDGTKNIIVYSRDWTVETVVNQIEQGNIDLDPAYQRRNAWNDIKKSQLIESYLMGYPVPEIVLAEHPRERKKFIVIDGKQRLLTLCGFLKNEKYESWKVNKLKGLRDLVDLNGMSFSDFKQNPDVSENVRLLANSDVRCTIISNVPNDDVLYDIFYRLNAGATPLTMQELRQVLYAGPFPKYMLGYTSELSEIHNVLKLNGPDNRLKDVETLTRNLAFNLNSKNYTGNLKKFLDEFTDVTNKNWGVQESKVLALLNKFDSTIKQFADLAKGYHVWGRKYNSEQGKFESRFNTVLFEVQLYYWVRSVNMESLNLDDYEASFSDLCSNPEFLQSISSSTKNLSEYKARYEIYSSFFNKLTGDSVSSPWM